MSDAGTPGPADSAPALTAPSADDTDDAVFFAVPPSPQTAPYEEKNYPATSFSAPLPIVDASAPLKPKRPRRRRGLFWVLVLMAAVVVLAGSIAAVVTYMDQGKPSGVVKRYFAALSRGDAAAALSFGTLPGGSHALLTDAVLRAQNAIGRIENVAVLAETSAGSRVSVTVQYSLKMSVGATSVTDTVAMTKAGGSWRLVSPVVPVDVAFSGAASRIAVAGAVVPDGVQLIFPGAMPFSFDTPNLELAENSRVIRFAGTTDPLQIQLSKAGQAVVSTAVAQAVSKCLAGTSAAQALCPLPPSGRFVPGSLRGKLTKPTSGTLSFALGATDSGQVDGDGTLAVAGTVQSLDFNNLASSTDFTGDIPITFTMFTTVADSLTWGSS